MNRRRSSCRKASGDASNGGVELAGLGHEREPPRHIEFDELLLDDGILRIQLGRCQHVGLAEREVSGIGGVDGQAEMDRREEVPSVGAESGPRKDRLQRLDHATVMPFILLHEHFVGDAEDDVVARLVPRLFDLADILADYSCPGSSSAACRMSWRDCP